MGVSSDGVDPRWSRGSAAWPTASALALLLAACAPLPPRAVPAGRTKAPPPDLAAITAEPAGPFELRGLEALGDLPTARLRRAFLLLERRDTEAALDLLNRLLFGPDPMPSDVVAIAHHLRARTFDAAGDAERARYEHDQALAAAVDPELRRRLAEAAAGPAAKPPEPPVAASAPATLPRSAWRAAPPRTRHMGPMGPVSRITVHHSASVVGSPRAERAAAAILGIQRHHQGKLDWGDIGYHFLVDPAGRIWTGRPLDWQGAHAGDDSRNRGNIGICLLGNYLPAAQGAPPTAQIEAMERLVAWLAVRYGIDSAGILTHRELRETVCPGPYVQVAVEELRGRLGRAGLAE